ncbi:uncharacterized protein B0P05DRAFT_600555 [Gilbertella persicaria]|uniref:uncharacterized protein n=1 Tax=Gilbertella persicaria TaxID=101096 RepID=UPI0022201163|nr:uncharacterized protein B0P05DRAFT_600555 [Gilbertella persicaria]KAI8051093.1 hypothetical protein B0P05DRAFT_600555 [Gilbertella persicaria]
MENQNPQSLSRADRAATWRRQSLLSRQNSGLQQATGYKQQSIDRWLCTTERDMPIIQEPTFNPFAGPSQPFRNEQPQIQQQDMRRYHPYAGFNLPSPGLHSSQLGIPGYCNNYGADWSGFVPMTSEQASWGPLKTRDANLPLSPMDSKTSWSKVVKGETSSDYHPIQAIQSPDLRPTVPMDTCASVSDNSSTTRYITDSISYMANNLQLDTSGPTQTNYTVVKVTNFPWDVNAATIRQAFERSVYFDIPSELPQCVHIMMDTKSGKTLGTAFVQIISKSKDNLRNVLKSLSLGHAQCPRRAQFSPSSQDELCRTLFQNWKGDFHHGVPVLPVSTTVHEMMTQKPVFFINQKELQALLNVCRNFKVNYNRRCSERPFEYLISIIMHMPWNHPKTVTTTQRDIIYECYKLATGALFEHMSKAMHSFEDDILLRFVRAGILCDGFTYKQKNDILHHAQMDCPKDLVSYVQVPAILNNSEFTTLLRM